MANASSTNLRRSLWFAGITIAGAVVLVGSEDRQGALPQAVETIAPAQGGHVDPSSAGGWASSPPSPDDAWNQGGPNLPPDTDPIAAEAEIDASSGATIIFPGDEDLIDPATGYDPTPPDAIEDQF